MKMQQIVNLQITLELLDFLIENPELRFIQALWALGIVDNHDRFYEPSSQTLDVVKSNEERQKELKCQNLKDFQGS